MVASSGRCFPARTLLQSPSINDSFQETFSDIKARRSAEGVARLEFNVLSEMATFIVEGPQCASVAALLVPYIRRKVRGGLPLTEMNRRSVLLSLSRLLPRVERPEQYTVDIGRQLLLNGRPETIAACVAAACALGPRFAQSSQLLCDMNAMNPKRLSEPVCKCITLVFAPITGECAHILPSGLGSQIDSLWPYCGRRRGQGPCGNVALV